MSTNYLNGQLFKNLIINGCQSLSDDCDRINALNVFPVPDGDTGTNMKRTMDGGVEAIINSKVDDIGLISKEMSRGMTFSARGNSGVILSQFFKGLALGLLNKDKVDVNEFALAMQNGVKQAYAVVKNPTEGTILTVMREACQKALDSNVDSFEAYFEVFLTEANLSLERTPELLPVLKKAGVVDSGAAGYIKVIEGMALAIDGTLLEYVATHVKENKTISPSGFNADSELEFGYCTEFILQLQNSKVDIKNFDLKIIEDFLETIGDSIVAFKDDDIVKVHVHTFTPGKVINYCQQFGEYVTFKMENMSVQHSESTIEEQREFKETTIVAVSSGDGISSLFEEMGVDYIVSGGQTMNPSTEDFIAAFNRLNTNNIIVFPNNSNIIMAAKQAAQNYSKATVTVIPTKTIAECYSALSLYDEGEVSEVVETFESAIESVTSLEVTYSIRDTEIDDFKINTGDFLGFANHQLKAVDKDKISTVIDLLNATPDIDSHEVLTVIYGEDVTEEEIKDLTSRINEKFDWLEVGFIEGKQKVYSFIISLE